MHATKTCYSKLFTLSSTFQKTKIHKLVLEPKLLLMVPSLLFSSEVVNLLGLKIRLLKQATNIVVCYLWWAIKLSISEEHFFKAKEICFCLLKSVFLNKILYTTKVMMQQLFIKLTYFKTAFWIIISENIPSFYLYVFQH